MASGNGKFTGKHMALVFVGGFGVVIAVNLIMATFAVGSFHGTVVDNSYVASQKFNGWLDEAEKDRALGWKVEAKRLFGGQIQITTTGVPENAEVQAVASRSLGEHEPVSLTFVEEGAGRWVSNQSVEKGRWDLRVIINATGANGDPQGWADIVALK